MPFVTVDLSFNQLEELKAYATRHEMPLEEVVRRALDRFLALAWTDPDEVAMMSQDQYLVDHQDHLDRLNKDL